MTHLWLRAEQRRHEQRAGLTPDGAAELMAAGIRVTVEESADRIIPIEEYAAVGCQVAASGSWPKAPREAIIFGLKELPEDGTPLRHRHIMFGHAFKGQFAGHALLQRFAAGGGTLLDLEYLTDRAGARIAAFGYWAGFIGAALSLKCWAAQQGGGICGSVGVYSDQEALIAQVQAEVAALTLPAPAVIIVGAKGRVGRGAADLAHRLGCPLTLWDMEETANGGPFPEILAHPVFINAVIASPRTPVLVAPNAIDATRALRVIGDVACDPDSDYNPVPLYSAATSWDHPAVRVREDPALDIMAIDNLPSMLPREASEDYAAQLLPALKTLVDPQADIWTRAQREFQRHIAML